MIIVFLLSLKLNQLDNEQFNDIEVDAKYENKAQDESIKIIKQKQVSFSDDDDDTPNEDSDVADSDVVLSSSSDYSSVINSDRSSEDHTKQDPEISSGSDYSSSTRGDRSSEKSEDKELNDNEVAAIVAGSILGVSGLAGITYGILVLCGIVTCCSCCKCFSCNHNNPNSSTSQDFIFEADQDGGSYGRIEDI